MSEIEAIQVPPGANGMRLDRFLADVVGSRAQAQSLIGEGKVRVNGLAVQKRHPLSGGERLEITRAAATASPAEVAPAQFGIVHEDEHLFVVEKPAGVVVHPARGHRSGTLAQALEGRAAGGDEPTRAGIVHRLDRDTSGLLVVAKNDATHRALKALLSERRIAREYVALVDGHPPARSGTIEAPIGRDRRDRKKVSIDTDTPREARTHYEIERVLPDSALLRVKLDTGRTHQIRVHMAAIGHPVSGDPLYGEAGRFGLERQFLHAAKLRFPHPVTGAVVDVSSQLPADLTAALFLASQPEEDRRRDGPSKAAPPQVRTEPPEVGEGGSARGASHHRR